MSAVTATAKPNEDWLRLRTANFTLVGNASANDIRRVAMRLEEFREAFRQVFNRAELNSTIPTTVVVFKNNVAYRPFKPQRADGTVDDSITGYFMPGEDANYITLTSLGDETDYGTIFHEYTHFIVSANYGKTGVPPWFNEGLAEYYETFSLENDQTVKLGLIQDRHFQYLKYRGLMPLAKLFAMSSYELDQAGDRDRKTFYAQSWALVHYLVQAGKIEGFNKFLTAVVRNVPPEQAFQQAFQITYAEMEAELKNYLTQRTYNLHVIKLPERIKVDTNGAISPIDEAEANATLGDLLYHLRRAADAVPYLTAALAVRPAMPLANSAMGMVKLQQRRTEEAKKYLEKAIETNSKNFLALYRLAHLLSREDRDEFGLIASYPREKAAKIRDLLKRAIAANPAFVDSYDLLAFVALTNGEELDEVATYLQNGLRLTSGAPRLLLRLAEIYLKQDKLQEAGTLATQAAATPDDSDTRNWAGDVLAKIKGRQDARRSIEAEKARYSGGPGQNRDTSGFRHIEVDKAPTAEETSRLQADAFMRALNQVLTVPAAGETRVVGTVDRIDCGRGTITYAVTSAGERFTLSSRDFQGLKLRSYITSGVNRSIDCGITLTDALAVLIYQPYKDRRLPSRGELKVLEFVPPDFRFVDTSGLPPPAVIYSEKKPEKKDGPEIIEFDNESLRRSTMLASIRSALRKPTPGELRDLGRVESLECTKSGMLYTIKTATRTLRLTVTSPESLAVKGYTPDIDGLQITCGVSLSDLVAVFIYKDVPDDKKFTAGELVSLEFVPKAFTL